MNQQVNSGIDIEKIPEIIIQDAELNTPIIYNEQRRS